MADFWDTIFPRLQTFNDVGLIIHDICSKEDENVVCRVTVMLWMLWNNKHNWVWNNNIIGFSIVDLSWQV